MNLRGLFTLAGIVALLLGTRTSPAATWYCACDEHNDLARVLEENGEDVRRFLTPAEALEAAPEGAAVLLLADGYPERTTEISAALLDRAVPKKLRVYLEYPASLPGLKVEPPREARVERAVVASDFFGPDLTRLRILAIHGLHFTSVEVERPHIVAARVAGFDTASFGLPQVTVPLLFEHPRGDLLVSTTRLSHFVTGRYAPQDAWQSVWTTVLSWLRPNEPAVKLAWTPSVRASYGRDEPLPEDAERQAIRRGVEWFERSKLLVDRSRVAEIERAQKSDGRLAPFPPEAPVGDGSLGILEAPLSTIRPDGSQIVSVSRRGDCHAESAMALSFGGRLLDETRYTRTARNLLDFYLFDSPARKGGRGDPDHAAYGLISWGVGPPAWMVANYGDDNARLMLGTLAAASLQNEDRWDEALMMCLLGNLRTCGQLGYRNDRIDMPQLDAHPWTYFFRRRVVSHSPHMEAYLWACYLWAYHQTGDELFLDRATTALRMTMDQYTDGWRWTNGLAQERARILLPLSWLVRVKDTPEHRALLEKGIDGLLALEEPCGAIREELGLPGRGMFPPPASNEAYGTNEASLIQHNGEPVSDLLYTTNFAFLGLHEAAAATRDPRVQRAADKLADFLVRIQVRSEAHPQVDGGWFRAFDFGRWEAWGSNADLGWGAWAIESGWTQGWIVSVLALRQMKTSLWDLTAGSRIEKHHPRLRKQMLPEDVVESILHPKPVKHAALVKPVTLQAEPAPQYPGGGAAGLTDGQLGDEDHTAPEWLGFLGSDLDAVIDLGELRPIDTVALRFLRNHPLGIYLPTRVELSVSTDGTAYRPLAPLKPEGETGERGIATYRSTGLDAKARFVQVKAKSVGVLPPGHSSAGVAAWLFTDEVLVDPRDGVQP